MPLTKEPLYIFDSIRLHTVVDRVAMKIFHGKVSVSISNMVFINAIACTLFSVVLSQTPITQCSLPADPKCLVQNAQYTVVGTVTSSKGPSPNFNATMNIKCVLASYSNPISKGDGLVGKDLLVTSWGILF